MAEGEKKSILSFRRSKEETTTQAIKNIEEFIKEYQEVQNKPKSNVGNFSFESSDPDSIFLTKLDSLLNHAREIANKKDGNEKVEKIQKLNNAITELGIADLLEKLEKKPQLKHNVTPESKNNKLAEIGRTLDNINTEANKPKTTANFSKKK